MTERVIPQYPAEGTVIERVDWLFAYGSAVLMYTIAVLFVALTVRVLQTLKVILRLEASND